MKAYLTKKNSDTIKDTTLSAVPQKEIAVTITISLIDSTRAEAQVKFSTEPKINAVDRT